MVWKDAQALPNKSQSKYLDQSFEVNKHPGNFSVKFGSFRDYGTS